MTDLKAQQSTTEKDLLVAFFDLSRFAREVRGLHSRELFDLMSQYYEFVGDIIENAGGTIVKFIGDAALIVFAENHVDKGVLALQTLKEQGDAWLSQQGMHSHHTIRALFGSVTCGHLGTKSEKRFDVFGDTVNIAATLSSNNLAITPQVFRKLSSETRKHFKKHTPPITYIPVGEAHHE